MPGKFQEAWDNRSTRLITTELTNLGLYAQLSPANRSLVVSHAIGDDVPTFEAVNSLQ